MVGNKNSSDSNESADKPRKATSADQRFWRALKPEASPAPLNNADESGSINVSGDVLQNLDSEQLVERREVLRSMLAASEARQQDVLKSRRPTMAVGQSVLVRSGPHRNKIGTILDADFIHSRVYLHMDEPDEPLWIEFSQIASIPEEP